MKKIILIAPSRPFSKKREKKIKQNTTETENTRKHKKNYNNDLNSGSKQAVGGA
jgi:hypothetical protein